MHETDEEVRVIWGALSESLDATRHLLLDLGGALHAIQSLGVRSSDFPMRTLEERSRPKTQQFLFDRSPRPTGKQRSIKAWWKILSESQRDFSQCYSELNSAVTAMPDELVSLLSGVRQVPWRAHFRRNYVDQLPELPRLVIDFDMAHISEESIPPGYHRATILSPLIGLLAHSEVCSPYDYWKRLLRRANSYAADLRSIKYDIGGALPDGPVPPNRWRRDGVVTEKGMTPLSWKLVTFLWSRRNRSGTIEECADAVFGEDRRTVDKIRIGSHRKNANNFFRENRINWEVKTKGDYVSMQSVDAQGSPQSN